MSDDIIRAKGYAIYKSILNKALIFLMNAIVRAIITEYKVWDATLLLKIRVVSGGITRRTAEITIKERDGGTLEDPDRETTTVLDRSELNHIMDEHEFDLVIHSFDEGEEK
jgi:hypothetical protein